MEQKEKFTWADLKKVTDVMSDKKLQQEVIIWTDDEKGYLIEEIIVAKEDYVYHIDYPEDGSSPISALDLNDEDKPYYKVSIKKGERVISAS